MRLSGVRAGVIGVGFIGVAHVEVVHAVGVHRLAQRRGAGVGGPEQQRQAPQEGAQPAKLSAPGKS